MWSRDDVRRSRSRRQLQHVNAVLKTGRTVVKSEEHVTVNVDQKGPSRTYRLATLAVLVLIPDGLSDTSAER